MTAIANIIKTILAAIGLSCAVALSILIYALYNGHETKVAEVACAVQTDGVAEYSTCMYEAGQSID